MTSHNPLTAPAIFSREEMAARIPAMPDGWNHVDDLALMHGLALGMKLGEIGAMQGKSLDAMKERFLQLRRAAVGHGVFTVPAQERLTEILEDRARLAGAGVTP